MRLISFNQFQVGVWESDQVYDVSSLIEPRWQGTAYAMTRLIETFDDHREQLAQVVTAFPSIPVDSVRWLPPIPRPGQILGAPTNYTEHRQEMQGTVMTDPNRRGTPETLGFFWKSPGSIAGPADTILLPPFPGRRFDHEAELGVVIGRMSQGVLAQEADSAIFGYTCLMDLTMRWTEAQKEERSMRKSYATFTPIGPCIVTRDAIADPNQLEIRLWVNQTLRQSANTRQMIVPVPKLIELASRVMPLMPGDLIATGTPAGVGSLEPGDTVRIAIEQVGEMALPVSRRDW